MAALGSVLKGWFADPWVARQGFPLGDLANRTGKYFAAVLEAPRSLEEETWAALERGDMPTYYALQAKIVERDRG